MRSLIQNNGLDTAQWREITIMAALNEEYKSF